MSYVLCQLNVGVVGQMAAAEASESAFTKAWQLYLLVLLLVIILLVAVIGFGLLRSTRRLKEHITREPADPTDASDVWAMHKLPDDYDEERQEE